MPSLPTTGSSTATASPAAGMKQFLVSAIGAALELGIGTADDVLKYVTPDVLSNHLPRPLWARLITACLGAPKVNAQLVVDTVGIPNLCEHIPGSIMWNVLADIGARSLGKPVLPVLPATTGASTPLVSPVPPSIAAGTGSGPAASSSATDTPRSRSPSRQPFRQVGTNAGAASRSGGALSGGVGTRRPQAAATGVPTPVPTPPSGPTAMPAPVPASALVGSRVTPPSPRRGTTATDFDIDTDVRAEHWKNKDVNEVDDDQLIDWSSSEETVTGGDGFDRKPGRG